MITIAQARLGLSDPHDCTDASDTLTILHSVYDTLVRRVGKGFVPHLARQWDVSQDACRWVFQLQDGVRFHDGTVCDAQAVVDNLERMAREDKGYTLGAPAVWRQYLGGAAFEILDAKTFGVILKEPMADLLDVLEQGFIVAPSTFGALDAGDYATQIGSGPYRLSSVEQEMVIATCINCHFAGQPEHSGVKWKLVRDPEQRLALLKSGAIQVANDLDFQASRDLGDMRHEYLSPVAIVFLLNAAKGPMSDSRVRRALSLAIDRDAIVNTVKDGAAEPLFGFVSPNHFGTATDQPDLVNRDFARSLLADAGYGSGLTLEVDCPTRLPDEAERLTKTVAKQLSEVGIRLNIHVHPEREDYAHMVRRKEIRDLCVFDSSPMSTFRVLHEKIDSRVAGSWWQGYKNQLVETLIDKGRQTTNRATRSEIWQQVYTLLQNDPAWLTLYNPIRVIGLAGSHPDFAMPPDGVIDVARLPDLESN